MGHADSCIQQPSCLCHHHTITLPDYCHLPNLTCQTEVECPNRIHRSKTKRRREPNPKLVQHFLPGAALEDTVPQRSRCDVANNGAHKPTLSPFAFAMKKKYRECSIHQVTSKKKKFQRSKNFLNWKI